MYTRLTTIAVLCLAAATADAKLGPYVFSSGGGKSSTQGKNHFSATGLGMAVGRVSGGGFIVYHGYLASAAARRDEEPPEIDPKPANFSVGTPDNGCVADVQMPAITVTDNRDRNPVVTYRLLTDPAQDIDLDGEIVRLGLGSYDAIIIARDRYDNESRHSFRVDVVDRGRPTIDPLPDPTPANEPREATSPVGTAVAVNFGCEDGCDPDPDASRDPRSARFAVGDTAVTLTCQDNAGNRRQSVITIRVRDTQPPRVARNPEAIRAQCDSPRGATINVPALVWSDNGSTAENLTQTLIINPGDDQVVHDEIPEDILLPKGVHTLRYTATDEAGNTGTTDLQVTVTNDQAPEIRLVSPAENGFWHNDNGDLIVQFDVFETCVPEGQEPNVNLTPAPVGGVQIDGQRVTARYRNEGVYPLGITVTTADGEEVRDNSLRFGIDRTPPSPLVIVPSQLGVANGNARTYPIIPRADAVALNVGGEDDGDGDVSGVKTVEVVLDPDGDDRELAEHAFDGGGNPERGPRRVTNVNCEERQRPGGGNNANDRYCSVQRRLDLRHIPRGEHVIEIRVTDYAGNVGTGRAFFTSHSLHTGLGEVLARLQPMLGGLPANVRQRLQLALPQLSRARGLAELEIDGSAFDSPVFLGGARRSVQDATIRLVEAIGLSNGATRATLASLTDVLQRLGASDVELLEAWTQTFDRDGRPAWLRAGLENDSERVGDALELVRDNARNANFNQAAANNLISLFHAKSHYEEWLLDFRLSTRDGNFDRKREEYGRSAALLEGIVDELAVYLTLEGVPGQNFMRDVRNRLIPVADMLRRLEDPDIGFIEVDHTPEGAVSDQLYVTLLLELREVANFTQGAANQGVWTRNYQWPFMMVIRFMTQASVENAVFTFGNGRQEWTVYDQSLAYIDLGVDLLAARRVQEVIELYGLNRDVHCLMIRAYHCDFLADEGNADQDRRVRDADIPQYCEVRFQSDEGDFIPEDCRFTSQDLPEEEEEG